MTDLIDDDVCPMEVDSDCDEESQNKPVINNNNLSSDEEDDEHNTFIFKQHEYEYDRLGIKYLQGLGMDELDEIYEYMYGDEPFCNMTKLDVINCIVEYFQ